MIARDGEHYFLLVVNGCVCFGLKSRPTYAVLLVLPLLSQRALPEAATMVVLLQLPSTHLPLPCLRLWRKTLCSSGWWMTASSTSYLACSSQQSA